MDGGGQTTPGVELLVGFITFADTFMLGLLNPIYPMLVQSDRIGATAFASIMSVGNAGALVASPAFGRLSDIHGRRVAVVAASSTTLAGFALYAAGLACDGASPASRLLLPLLLLLLHLSFNEAVELVVEIRLYSVIVIFFLVYVVILVTRVMIMGMQKGFT